MLRSLQYTWMVVRCALRMALESPSVLVSYIYTVGALRRRSSSSSSRLNVSLFSLPRTAVSITAQRPSCPPAARTVPVGLEVLPGTGDYEDLMYGTGSIIMLDRRNGPRLEME